MSTVMSTRTAALISEILGCDPLPSSLAERIEGLRRQSTVFHEMLTEIPSEVAEGLRSLRELQASETELILEVLAARAKS